MMFSENRRPVLGTMHRIVSKEALTVGWNKLTNVAETLVFNSNDVGQVRQRRFDDGAFLVAERLLRRHRIADVVALDL